MQPDPIWKGHLHLRWKRSWSLLHLWGQSDDSLWIQERVFFPLLIITVYESSNDSLLVKVNPIKEKSKRPIPNRHLFRVAADSLRENIQGLGHNDPHRVPWPRINRGNQLLECSISVTDISNIIRNKETLLYKKK